MSWDNKFKGLAEHVAQWSKDRSTKVGAIIVNGRNAVVSIGYNGFPRGVNDDIEDRHDRPAKYKWTEHAERNAIYNAGQSLIGCSMYLNWFPCVDCARAISQSGIIEIICEEPDLNDPTWGDDFKITIEMMVESGVSIRYYS